MPRGKRKKEDDWIEGLMALGIGVLAVYFLKKLTEGGTVETTKTCNFCGHSTEKWARMCPMCRNTFPI